MFLRLLTLLWLACLSLLPGVLLAGTLNLSSHESAYSLSPHLDILEDKSGDLTLAEVSSPAQADHFNPNLHSTPNFGFSSSTYWFHFTVTNAAAGNVATGNADWVIEVGYPLLDHFDLAWRETGASNATWQRRSGGNAVLQFIYFPVCKKSGLFLLCALCRYIWPEPNDHFRIEF